MTINVLTFHGFYDPVIGVDDDHDFIPSSTLEKIIKASTKAHFLLVDPTSVPRSGDTQRSLMLTFDDGLESCHRIALPVLSKYAVSGLFFIIPQKIGMPGFMSQSDIEDLIASGHTIGSHSLNHLDLTSISTVDAKAEIQTSKEILEERFNVTIDSFSFPFGKYNKTLIKICYDVGYRHVYTSVCGVNKSLEVQYIKRNNIYNNISDTTLLRYLNQPLGFRLGVQVRYFGIYVIKKLVGDHCYRSLRNGILRGR